MQDAFGIVVFAVAAAGAVVAVWCLLSSGSAYRQIGRGGLSLDEPGARATARPEPAPSTAAGRAIRDEELRQMIQARNLRRERRGEAPLDVDEELRRLEAETAPIAGSAEDNALRDEVRQLVVARNLRRARKGQEPLDVEAEVERQLRGV